jgi:hypothetical protein
LFCDSILEKFYVQLRRICTLFLLGEMFCIYLLNQFVLLVLFKFSMTFWTFITGYSTHYWRLVLKPDNIALLLSRFSFRHANIFLIYLSALVLDPYIFIIFTSFCWISSMSLLHPRSSTFSPISSFLEFYSLGLCKYYAFWVNLCEDYKDCAYFHFFFGTLQHNLLGKISVLHCVVFVKNKCVSFVKNKLAIFIWVYLGHSILLC